MSNITPEKITPSWESAKQAGNQIRSRDELERIVDSDGRKLYTTVTVNDGEKHSTQECPQIGG